MAKPGIRIESPYNPLAKENLGKSLADALLERDLGPLPPPEKFIAAGVYAIHYNGSFKAYARHEFDRCQECRAGNGRPVSTAA